MRSLERDVQDAVWAAIEPLIPPPPLHPLGCHRPRVPDRLCFRGILIRLTTGSSCQDIESILDSQVSGTTVRARRDEWIDAGISINCMLKHSLRSTASSNST
jgi:transposase